MRELGVYVREFPDGEIEIGVLEDYFGEYQIMDVGNFAYCMNWNRFEYPFLWIGYL